MADFLAVLSSTHRDNWTICKREHLWGTSRTGVAAAHVKRVAVGDRLFVWAAGEGLLAVAEITTGPRAVRASSDVPWPEPERYGFTFSIRVIAELDEAYADEFADGRGGNRTSRRLGLKGWQLQSGFAELDVDQAAACAAVFDRFRGPTPKRDPVAAAFLKPDSDVAAALLTLYRQRSRCADGELLVVGDEGQRELVLRELGEEPFTELVGCVRFLTRAKLADELRADRSTWSRATEGPNP